MVRTTITVLGTGMNNYLKDVGSTNYYKMSLIDHAGVIRYGVKNNRPTIVGISGHYKYGDHFAVAIGYEENAYKKGSGNLVTDSFFVLINNGWGHDDIYISISHVASTW